MKLSKELAELCGIIAGDGHIMYYKKNYDYRVQIFGDYKELDYHDYIKKLFIKIFNKCPKTVFKNDGISLYLNSKNIINKLIELGLPSGKKKYVLRIPKWVLEDKKLSTYFLRGLFDTDGCISFKKNIYPRISIELCSKNLIEDIKPILEKLDINYSYYKRKKKSNFGEFDLYSIYIYGKTNLEKWMKFIGSSNKKHLNKIEFWKKYGYSEVKKP